MIRSYSARVDVIRNGATLTTLHPISDPLIDCNAETAIKSSMSGIFRNDLAVNWLTDELMPVQVIDGIEYPVGIFPVGTVAFSHDANGVETVMVEAYDRCMILFQTKAEQIIHFPAGKNYLAAIEELLTEAGVALYMATPTTATLQTDREDWPIGTPYLEIINALLSEINYTSIWFDSRGFARLQPVKTPQASNIDHRYGEKEKINLLQRPCTVETDMFDAPNVFIAICSNPDLDAPMVATAVNDNPMSSLSTFRRGRRIVKTYKVDNIPSQQELQAYADTLRMNGMVTSEVATISTANLPGHGVFDTIAIMHPDIEGVFQEISWSLVLAPGQTMIHKLRRSIVV